MEYREANRCETVRCGGKVSQVTAVDHECITTRDGWTACHGDYGDIIEVNGERFIVSDIYDDGSVEIRERFVVRPEDYRVVKRRGRD